MKYINDFDFSVINDSAQRAGKELREIILSRRIEKKNLLINGYERPIPNVQFQG
jgi:guanylate kinase